MTIIRCFFAFAVPVMTSTELTAKGGTYRMEGRYNPQHIDSLPPEIRSSIMRKCSEPKALHPFAKYSDGSKKIELHFEHFVCDGDGTYCDASGCLHLRFGPWCAATISWCAATTHPLAIQLEHGRSLCGPQMKSRYFRFRAAVGDERKSADL